jgi:MFS family permease
MAHLASAETPTPQLAADRWTAYSVTVWAICMLGFAFDIYEATIMQLVTPLLIKEWGIAPATIGNITTVSRWVGLIGIFVFPTLADLYGRRPVLVLTILGYSLFTGLTGFAQGPLQLLIFTSITRITLQGETPVGMIMVSETAPTKWRATALGGLVGGYPFGYMLCSLTALVVVPLWGFLFCCDAVTWPIGRGAWVGYHLPPGNPLSRRLGDGPGRTIHFISIHV